MAYIRDKKEELTGYQEHAPYNPNIDVQCDFVMVYGIDESMPQRIAEFKKQGYVVHLMTGIAWGEYQDYLYGRWDGREHWDEAQKARDGRLILHGKDVPYMVPTIAFADYLTEKLKVAVDAGVEAIHLEEPEFWDYGGYSEAFKREYELYYREPWRPMDEDLDVRYKASRLKAYLYARALDRICGALREYAKVKHNRVVRFYVPTHSLLNYTQWKIMSPEGALIDLPVLDGYIAQVWTGTSRSENVYQGVLKERTFETAYLEYGIMQELTKGTGRKMWFLQDPIEDNPEYPWEDYEYNYLKTVTASLLHPNVHNYEICPWPNRVFNGKYPFSRKERRPMENAKTIPPEYCTLLNNIFNTLGDMDQDDFSFDGVNSGVGIIMSDTGLFQRTYPDGIIKSPRRLGEHQKRIQSGGIAQIPEEMELDEDMLKEFIESGSFPNFYGMALPLLKYGLPVRPVQMDNIRRFPAYLDDYKNLILSYEYIKPLSPDINNAFATWTREGGTLIYIGDGSDPYHGIQGWWNRPGRTSYDNPAQHLFEMMGLPRELEDGVYTVGKGVLAVYNICPAKLCLNKKIADQYRSFVKDVLERTGSRWDYTNHITLRRGYYIISAVMDESVDDSPQIFEGVFADMYTPDFKIVTRKVLHPDENTLLMDLSKVKHQNCIIGTSVRIFKFECGDNAFELTARGAASLRANIRLKLAKPIEKVTAVDEDGNEIPVEHLWDELSNTVLLSYDSCGKQVVIKGIMQQK